MKAINLAKNRQGLVQVLRTVTVKGTTFIRPYWIRPNEVKSNDKVIGGFQNLPKGHSMKPDNIAPNAKVPQEIRDIVTAYQENYLKTRPDKKSADEAFFNDLKANGISWEEHPMPLINMMRAKMAVNISVMAGWKPPGVDKSLLDKAKQYIRQDNTTPQPHTSASQSATISLPPKANTASQASKDKTKAFFKSFANDQDFFDALKQMGVSWKENSHPRINGMRAKEALALHIENGFDPVEAFSILNTIPPATDDSDTTVPPVQDIPDDTPPKDESLLEIPDDATPAQVEIIKYVNQMTDLQEIKKCALMGIVPEDNISKEYIISTMIRKMYDWIHKGMIIGFQRKDQVKRGKTAPNAVAKRFKEDCLTLGIDMSQYSTTINLPLGKDLGVYLDIPEDSKSTILSALDSLFSSTDIVNTDTNGGREVLNSDVFIDPNDMRKYRMGASYIKDLNNAFSNYISDNPDDNGFSNLGYTGNDLDKCKAQFDLNKEGFVRYLNKLKAEYPADKELSDTIDESIKDYEELMKSLNYNHNLLGIVLQGKEGWEKNHKPYWFDTYKFGGIVKDPYSATYQVQTLETQSDDVINTLIKEGYTDDEIMSALSDFYRNDSSMTSIFVPNSRKPLTDTGKVPVDLVTIDTSLNTNSEKEWTTYSLMYTLIKFQKMRGIYGTPQGEKYMETYRQSNTFNVGSSNSIFIAEDLNLSRLRGSKDTPEVLLEYMEYLKQVSELPIESVKTAKTLGAKLFGRENVFLHQDPINGDITSFDAYGYKLEDSKYTMISNIMAAAQQHRINEIVSRSLRNLSFKDKTDFSKIFKYYSGGLMKNQQGRLTQYGNAPRGTTVPATYTAKELEEQIQKQLDNSSTYSQEYVMGMKKYFLEKSDEENKTVYQLVHSTKNTINSDKQGIKAAMNRPSRDIFFNAIASVVSNIPGMENVDKSSLAVSLGYEPFDPYNPQKPSISPKKPKKPKVTTVVSTPPPTPTPEEIKEARQHLFDRAMGTLAAEDDVTNAEMMKDFNERFDYKPGDKTLEGTVVYNGIHQNKDTSGNYTWGSRVPIFNSRFFAIKNTTVWEDRFRTEQQRMKDLGLDEDCYKEMDLFHACSRSCVGGIIGRDQGWFMGNEYEAAGKMLGVGAYFGLTGGKSAVYCGDNPYSIEHRGELAPDTADGTYILAKVMRGDNPKHTTKGVSTWDIEDSKYTSSSADIGVYGLHDCEIAVRNNALILPHHIVDVSCRIVGRNIDQDAQGNFVDDKGNILANKDGVSVGLQQQLENNPI